VEGGVDDINALMQGFGAALSPANVLFMLVGVVLGVVGGALPGLRGAAGIAILLPFTFAMAQKPGGAVSAIILVSGIYWGALFGGAVTAILFGVPGELRSTAATLDGQALAQKGRAGSALTAAFTSSFIGGLIAVIVITFVSPMVAGVALRFGPPEFFSVYLLTFCALVAMSGGHAFKTIASMTIGFALAAFGMDSATGAARLPPVSAELFKGFDFLVAAIGLFGIGEILLSLGNGRAAKVAGAKIDPKIVLETWKELPRYWATSLRSAAVGCFMGVVPGGAARASSVSYGIAKRFSPDGKDFGSGKVEGVVAPEVAAHAAGASALLPMIALGVPGTPGAAVLLAGLLSWGLQPGPLLFVEEPDFVWGLIASMYAANVAAPIVVLACIPLVVAVLRIPFSIIAAVVVVICATGAYTLHGSFFDVWLMLGFGVVGYVFKKFEYPLAPLVLALALGDRVEESFRNSVKISHGDLSIFSDALAGGIAGLALILLSWPLVRAIHKSLPGRT
jgi:putative tricarboxylic transport membrane protein